MSIGRMVETYQQELTRAGPEPFGTHPHFQGAPKRQDQKNKPGWGLRRARFSGDRIRAFHDLLLFGLRTAYHSRGDRRDNWNRVWRSARFVPRDQMPEELELRLISDRG